MKKYHDYDGNLIKEKYYVEGEFGGYFKTLKEAKQAAKLQSKEHQDFIPIYVTDSYTWTVAYENGKEVK